MPTKEKQIHGEYHQKITCLQLLTGRWSPVCLPWFFFVGEVTLKMSSHSTKIWMSCYPSCPENYTAVDQKHSKKKHPKTHLASCRTASIPGLGKRRGFPCSKVCTWWFWMGKQKSNHFPFDMIWNHSKRTPICRRFCGSLVVWVNGIFPTNHKPAFSISRPSFSMQFQFCTPGIIFFKGWILITHWPCSRSEHL